MINIMLIGFFKMAWAWAPVLIIGTICAALDL